MHIDEALSISICNRNEYGFWGKLYEQNKEYTGKELKEISLFDDASIKDALSDVYHMHKFNNDPPHTNFYYSLLRLTFAGTKTSNLQYIYWRGCLLNVFIFAFSFFFMFLLLRRFTNNLILISILLFIAFINPASLSLTVFLRPYELQQLFIIILTLYVTCILQAMAQNVKIETVKNFFIGAIVLALTMLSGYFSLILICLYGAVLVFLCIYKKNYKLLSFFIIMLVAGLLGAKLLYLDFGNMTGRGNESFSKLEFSNIIPNLLETKDGIINIIFLYSFIYFAFAFIETIFTLVNAIKNKKDFALSCILVIAFICFFAFLYFAPYKIVRYIAPLFPLFVLSFVALNNYRQQKIIVSLIAVFFLVSSYLLHFDGMGAKIEHIDDSTIANYKEIQETKLPIFVRGRSGGQYAYLVPYLADDNKVIFIDDFSEINENYSQKIPCMFINQHDESDKYDFATENLLVKQVTGVHNHDVYLIEK